MLERIATALEVLALGLWAGAMACFAFIAAPTAFRTIGSMATFSEFVGATIRGVGTLGLWCGAIALAAAFVRARDPNARGLAFLRGGLVVVALAASAYEARAVVPNMDAIAASIGGPIDSVPKTDARRIAYDEAHALSTRVYGAAFLCIVSATSLVAFGRARRELPQ